MSAARYVHIAYVVNNRREKKGIGIYRLKSHTATAEALFMSQTELA